MILKILVIIWLIVICLVISIVCNWVFVQMTGYNFSGFLGGLFGLPLGFLFAKILEMED